MNCVAYDMEGVLWIWVEWESYLSTIGVVSSALCSSASRSTAWLRRVSFFFGGGRNNIRKYLCRK